MIARIDPISQASNVAGEARIALGLGDTRRAREKYAEAGEILEKRIVTVRRQSEKQHFRFLAASQSYHGGDYAKALALAQKIQVKLLPANVRHLFPKFLRDAKERAAPEYGEKIRSELARPDPWKSRLVHAFAELTAH